ncbi:MAG: LysR family transcriptional regulator [Streptococcaceae bacterium]|jgi:DNA-binding transcriptional LysR family regulator|nr:LysR family transcriptional regulator [Streptococcaceae bacterium]
MRIQQLQYIIKIVEVGSMSEAAKRLFITQPSLSNAVKDLEKEMKIQIFIRQPRGITLTSEGTEFLAYARQVVEQADLLIERYTKTQIKRQLFAVSAQHYAFVVNAFVRLLKDYDMSQYELTLRETRTFEIIEDVKNFRSEIGVLYLNDFNRDVLTKLFDDNQLRFTSLFTTSPYVFVSTTSPLAAKSSVTLADLEDFPYLSYEQGVNNSFYFAEEILSTIKHRQSIVVSDRATLFNLLIGLDGYTISTGILNSDLNGDNIIAIPLEIDEQIEIGYITHLQSKSSKMAESFLLELKKIIENEGLDS